MIQSAMEDTMASNNTLLLNYFEIINKNSSDAQLLYNSRIEIKQSLHQNFEFRELKDILKKFTCFSTMNCYTIILSLIRSVIVEKFNTKNIS